MEFGRKSLDNLSTAHRDLQLIFSEAIKVTKIDFGITEGHRSLERQKILFDQGKSKIDGISKKSKHNYNPSLAVDIYIYHPDIETRRQLAYDKSHLAYIAGLIDAISEQLYKDKKIEHKIRWGGNWDSDLIIDFDQSFDDFPHFELIKPITDECE